MPNVPSGPVSTTMPRHPETNKHMFQLRCTMNCREVVVVNMLQSYIFLLAVSIQKYSLNKILDNARFNYSSKSSNYET